MTKRLDEIEIKNLIAIHKQIKNKKDADKIKCIIYWGMGWSWGEIKEALFIDDRYIHEVVKRYKKGKVEELLKNHFDGNNHKMTKEQEKDVIEFVEKNIVPNAKVVCKYVKDKFGIEYTHQGMVITLRRLGFVYKKQKAVPGKIPSKEVQEEYSKKINEIINNLKDDEDAVFLDGSGFVHNFKVGYGWVKKGEEKIVKTNTGREKININGIYNPINNEVICIQQEGKTSVTQETNIELIEKYIKIHPEKKKLHIFCDNAKSNRSKKLRNYIESLTNLKVELVFLPPYSPNLNLIERLWKYSKNILLSSYYETFIEFKEEVTDFFEHKIKLEYHKDRLKTFIGRNFQIINTG